MKGSMFSLFFAVPGGLSIDFSAKKRMLKAG
jgi:hypothetical protein